MLSPIEAAIREVIDHGRRIPNGIDQEFWITKLTTTCFVFPNYGKIKGKVR